MSRGSRDDGSYNESPRGGGLANVFRGLASSRSPRTVPLAISPSSSLVVPTAELSAAPKRLSPLHTEAVELLRSGADSERVEAAQTLRVAIAEYPLNPVVDIWSAGKDMIELNQDHNVRRAGWELLSDCARHGSATDLERKEYFDTLSSPANPEDFRMQINAISKLTNGGRLLNGFDYELLPLLTRWLRQTYEAIYATKKTSSRRARSSTRSHSSSREELEDDFHVLFSFLTDVIKFSFNNASESAVCGLLDCLLHICSTTSTPGDMRLSIHLLDAIVTFGTIPARRLRTCVLVLSSIFCIVAAVRQEAWRTISHLCRSHYGPTIVRLLLDLLKDATTEDATAPPRAREIKGALSVLQQLLERSTEEGYPPLSYTYLMESFSNIATTTSSGRIQAYVLEIVTSLFGSSTESIHSLITDEDWSLALGVAAECCTLILSERVSNGQATSHGNEDTARKAISRALQRLLERLESLLTGDSGDYIPREDIADFLLRVYTLLSDSSISTLLRYLQEFRCCAPSDPRWEQNVSIVMDGFFRNKQNKTTTRLSALKTVIDAYEVGDLTEEGCNQDLMVRLVGELLEDALTESDVAVLAAIMDLVVAVAPSCDIDVFFDIMNTIKGIIQSDRPKNPPTRDIHNTTESSMGQSLTEYHQSLSGVAAKASVEMFLRTMNRNGQKAAKVYELLVNIARLESCEHDARLAAMKLLFRVRSDWTYHVFVTDDLDTAYLADVLDRSEETFKKRPDDTAANSRGSRNEHGSATRPSRGFSFSSNPAPDRAASFRSPSGPNPTAHAKRLQTWALPDPHALPSQPTSQTSPVLMSRQLKRTDSLDPQVEGDIQGTEDHSSEADADAVCKSDTSRAIAVIDFASWVDAVLAMLRGCDWEIYSFVLVHLPSQLSNHSLFAEAVPYIGSLRKLLCEQIRSNGFQEPPVASGLWRADVAICLFHSLNIMISYHELFQKGEEDEMVRTFGLGITTWERTARPCIHALTVCCHELPLSVGKSVVQMLNQMATIITQSTVAMHILEFLASLSRLPSVYVNFREEEYKIVFAICFRYIDHIKDKRRSHRSSQVNEAATPSNSVTRSSKESSSMAAGSDDLPEYVYSLAYHVLIFWYLALKLPDRASYVGWIAKRLFTDADGSGKGSDDYATTTLDLMQRVAYADVDESVEDGNFTESRFGEILKRRWLVGNSIVTVKQATSSGWAQIVKRQPSGVSAYLIRETFRPPPSHQVQSYVDVSREGQTSFNNILPSHLLVQLMSPTPQTSEASRPIPLPSDDATDRALRVLDRHSSLDGHKVGVIYIGEGQTEERDILANVSGSKDYVNFLNGLGSLTKLKDAGFNTQGLDREYNTDGEYTVCWRDRVTELVFHVTTQMPTNLERDPQVSQKKKHIGNDFVNIIFNDSGLPFKFDTFPSQFNYVNIVISPASCASFIATREPPEPVGQAKPTQETFYRVQVLSKPGFPRISPAAETKMVSLRALPVLIRLIALNASVFCHVWQSRLGGEHVSSWRSRLNEIRRLRDKHGPKSSSAAQSTSPSPTATGGGLAPSQQQQQHQQQFEANRPTTSVRDSLTSLRRTSMATLFSASEPASHRSSAMSSSAAANETETGATNGAESVVDTVDFSKWA